jgi:hypothetical protein
MGFKGTIFLLLLGMLLMGCTRNIYEKNLVKASRSKVEESPYGSYIEVDSKLAQHQGEFISYEQDTLFMMTEVGFEKIITDDILRIQIILSRNRARGYLIATGIVAIPALIGLIANSDYSDEFLTLGAVTVGLGLIATGIEASRKPTIIHYPTEVADIEDLIKYARFPGGLPDNYVPVPPF